MGSNQTKSAPQVVNDPDRLSRLPDHVIDKILSYLPIREAVGTSVLSRKWNKKWRTMPNLVFDTKCVSIPPSPDGQISNTLLKIVDHALLLHSGPIVKCKIRNYNRKIICLIPETDIERWILHLTERSIQKLVLQISIDECYKIPRSLFSCQTLRDLTLYCCCLELPTKFEGFKNLKKLDLYQVTITQDAFENLISRCPLLETLMLTEVDNISQINIHAPNLKAFDIGDKFEDISFEDTFQLIEVYVNLTLYLNSESNQSRLHECSSNLLKFFDRLPHIRSLAIHNYFLKYLTAGVVPTKLHTPCIELGRLSIEINFDDLKEISAALCLLRSSPSLRTLYIYARNKLHDVPWTPVTDTYCWEETFLKPETPIQVQYVTINSITGFQLELDFIRFLLLYSPALEEMNVNHVVNVRPELATELIRFKRASVDAEIIYKEEDSSENQYYEL